MCRCINNQSSKRSAKMPLQEALGGGNPTITSATGDSSGRSAADAETGVGSSAANSIAVVMTTTGTMKKRTAA